MQAIRLSYAELLRQVDGVARGLLALGVRRQDRVAIWAPNCAEWIVLGWAAAQIGAILVNINPALRSEGESVLEYVISFALVFLHLRGVHASPLPAWGVASGLWIH